MEDVEGSIRACLGVNKHPIYLRDLIRDYESIIGEKIPYREFGFSSLEKFLQSLPSLRVCGTGADAMVEASANAASAHVRELISRQKSSKKPSSKSFHSRGSRPYRGVVASSRGRARGASFSASRGGNYRPPPRFTDTTPPRHQNNYSYSKTPRFQPVQRPAYDSYKGYESWVALAQNNKEQNIPHQTVTKTDDDHSTFVKKEFHKNLPPRLLAKKENSFHQVLSAKKPNIMVNNNEARHTDDEHVSYVKPEFNKKLPQRLQSRKENSNCQVGSSQKPDLIVQVNNGESRHVIMKHLPTDVSSNNFITSPFGPKQLIEGLAQMQVENPIQNEIDFFLQDPPTSETPIKSQNLQEMDGFPFGSDHQEVLAENPWLSDDNVVSPELNIPPVPLPDEINITNNNQLLLEYMLARQWKVPNYKDIPRKLKRGPTQYTSIVEIFRPNQASKKFSSFPNEDTNLLVARGYAAKNALEELAKEETITVDIISTDRQTICERISDIVSGFFNGVFAKRVEDIYFEKFNEKLPVDWVEMLIGYPSVSIEPTNQNHIIFPRDSSLDVVVTENFVEPPKLDFPMETEWFVYITHVAATDSLWFRILGENYNDLYEELTTKMYVYYKNEGKNCIALNINKNHFYAVLDEENNIEQPQRVQVCEVDNESQLVLACLIDHGEVVELPFTAFYSLTPEFCELPKQAVHCSLGDLELFSKENYVLETLYNCVFDKVLVAKITSIDENEGTVIAELYDTSSDEDINLNKVLLDSFLNDANSWPSLPKVGGAPIEAEVTNVSKQGDIYTQVLTACFKWIKKKLSEISEEEIAEHKLSSFRQVVVNDLYLAKYSSDGQWYRAVVTAPPSVAQNKIPVRFVDYGNAESVSISDIADIKTFLPQVANLPEQAIKVGLKVPTNTLTNSEITELQTLLLNQNVIVKTIEDNPPLVDIFYKDELGQRALTSITSTILAKRDEKKKISDEASQQNVGGSLKQIEFDEDYFTTILIMASNPGNFIFTPLKYNDSLRSLEKKMQSFYTSQQSQEVSQDQIMLGNAYAVYHEGSWCRAFVWDKTVVESKVLVRFCDYGYINFVPISSLRHLHSDFREDPYYAVKGKLAGVAPTHSDWSVPDCLRFQELTVNKGLNGKVVSIEYPSESCIDMEVTLRLCDTTTSEDIYIDNVLVEEMRAVRL